MITKTIDLNESYQALFDEIREKSNGTINIDNLESFFGNIQEISALDLKFLRLPLDEPMFEIDANTRIISIPPHFKSNGLSVCGDNRAEIIFFSIDRYFDVTDLSNTKISINWKLGAESGKIEGLEDFMSTDIIPGKVVFGWPVENIVTKKSGALSFAIEFQIKDEEQKVIYDLNTLIASINIKDGLILGSDAQITSIDKVGFLSMLQNSVFGEGDAAVGPIHWVSGDGQGLVAGSNASPSGATILRDYANPIDLVTVPATSGGPGGIDDPYPRSTPVDLYGAAYVDDGTIIKYSDLSGNSLEAEMIEMLPERVLVEDRSNLDEDKLYFNAVTARTGPGGDNTQVKFEDIDDEIENLYTIKDLPDNYKYFKKDLDSDTIAYKEADETDLAKWGTAQQVTLYVKMAKIQATKAGSYAIRAQGIKVDNNGNKIGNGETISCQPIIIPEPKKPVAINIEKSVGDLELAEGYSFDEDASTNIVFLFDGSANLIASADVEDYGALRFVWKKKGDSTFDVVQNSGYKIDIIPPIGTAISANENTLTITEPGQYKVFVSNFKNGKYAEEVASDTYTASLPAGKITSAKAMFKLGGPTSTGNSQEVNGTIRYNSNQGSMAQKGITLSIVNIEIDEETGETGNLEYQWFKQEGIDEDAQLIEMLANDNGTLTITSGDGRFIPVIKNNYNGSIFTYQLDPIDVDDIA